MTNLHIREIPKYQATEFVYNYHYSKVFPRITKHYLGFFENDDLIGVVTLGWGTQPLQTIRKLLPNTGLTTQDYYEIGKMCFSPNHNKTKTTGSKIISLLVQWLKNNTNVKLLYTLADGIVGRVGYVYQASNFLYGGYFWTDVYMGSDGEKIHPRSAKELLKENAEFVGKEKLFWLTPDFCLHKGVSRIRGKMFRYMIPLNKKMRKLLIKNNWNLEYPKESDLQWKKQVVKGKYGFIEAPEFALDIVNVNKKNVESNQRNNWCMENMIFS